MAENKTTEHSTLEDIENAAPASMHPILEAAFKYQKQIAIGVIAIVVATGLYAGINSYSTHARTTAQAELGTILLEKKGQDKIAALEALLGSAPSSVKSAVLLELAQSTMNSGDYDKAVDFWNQLSGETDAELRIVARMGKAKCQILAGKFAEAVTELKDLAGVAPEGFTVPVYRELAVAAEAAGNVNEALSAYRKLAEQKIADKPFVEFKIAQLESK
ncbi:tetratricopeptide repeat protein [uncultured Pseudodesulfovibrio sp.]|uniref:tetratricopeptide repeat protein n=1 Tax=uncultured Pseudodesulfovibrio sp. TaxID=2035858 RepID=UPI0029C6E811|nr:tetratricopeptide repeat protein [uncultured Pseudodesulfovibrio sp.]